MIEDDGTLLDSDPGRSKMRYGLLQREVLRVLGERGVTSRSEVIEAVGGRLPLSPYERERTGKHQNPRFHGAITWGSTEMRSAGFIDKTDHGWAITSAGQKALETISDPDQFAQISRAAYKEHYDQLKVSENYKTPPYVLLDSALGLLDAEDWTTFVDLAELAGVGPGQVGDYLVTVQHEARPRVIDADAARMADQRSRVTTEDLREQLELLGKIPRAQRRAWLVRGGNVLGRDLVPVWFQDGVASLAATTLREVEPGITRDELKPMVDEDYGHTSYSQKAERLDEFHAFLSRMQVGHLVTTVSQGRLHVGRITGPATYRPSDDGRSNLRRAVQWVGGPEGVDLDDVPSDLSARLQVQRDVLDLTQQIDALEALSQTESDDKPPPPVERVVLAAASDELAKDLHIGREWLQECIDLLNDRPQLIFYGPPGTGKTYIAQRLARHVAGSEVRLVQFHPAYSYEDFFEGYRPVATGGFAKKPGPMRKIVDAARAKPTVPHVLIIDEINRGNLAKVFGELYFLLEYRDENIDLLYGEDEADATGFTLPRNVFVIGTMNTADRSIALVDTAMRRRFAFVQLHPSEPPTRGVLASWLNAKGYDDRAARLLDELNSRIEDPDFRIGPSYFMRDAVHQAGGLERVWRTAILPLLEEHHYGEFDGDAVAARYAYGRVASRVDRAEASTASEEPAGDPPPAPE